MFRPCVCPFICLSVGIDKKIVTKKWILEYSRVNKCAVPKQCTKNLNSRTNILSSSGPPPQGKEANQRGSKGCLNHTYPELSVARATLVLTSAKVLFSLSLSGLRYFWGYDHIKETSLQTHKNGLPLFWEYRHHRWKKCGNLAM